MSKTTDILDAIANPDLRAKVAAGWLAGDYQPMPTTDPAQALITSQHLSVPSVYDPSCYICNDPEFALMGMTLCWACPDCGGHVAADDGPECECGGLHP